MLATPFSRIDTRATDLILVAYEELVATHRLIEHFGSWRQASSVHPNVSSV